jgi:2-hydroxy-3-oxopropionate reductase
MVFNGEQYMRKDQYRIAFIGVGLMGGPMVSNLLEAGFGLTLWNRTRKKADVFAGRATIAASVQEALSEADVVISMLENGPVVDAVLYQSQALKQLSPGTTLIDMSSISPKMARHHAAQCQALGLFYLDAPVSGGTIGAAQKTLSIMVGGLKADFDRMKPVFGALGKATYIGPSGAGQLAKLANQAIVGITIGAVSEALLLAAKAGADPVAVREALMGGFAASRILELHGQRMIDRNFMPGATARVQLKDLDTILEEAKANHLQLPLSQRVFEEYQALVAAGHENVDHSGLLLYLESLNQFRLDGSDGSDGSDDDTSPREGCADA